MLTPFAMPVRLVFVVDEVVRVDVADQDHVAAAAPIAAVRPAPRLVLFAAEANAAAPAIENNIIENNGAQRGWI